MSTSTYLTDANGVVWSVSINPDGSLSTTPAPGGGGSSGGGGGSSVGGGGTGTNASPLFTLAASDIINSVVLDSQILTTNRTGLLDYVSRVQNRMLRETDWVFLKSQPLRFVTQPSISQYWLGTGAPPMGAQATGLDLTDLWTVLPGSVFDRTQGLQLFPDSPTVFASSFFNYPDGTPRPGPPRSFLYEMANPYVMQISPAPDTQPAYQPVPLSPVCSTVSGGNLPGRVYYVTSTYVDTAGNESTPSPTPTVIYVPQGYLLSAGTPQNEVASAQQVNYAAWNCYVGTSPATMTKQTSSPLVIQQSPVYVFGYQYGGPFLEPSTGLVAGTNAPTVNKVAPIVGYVIEFRYQRNRNEVKTLGDTLQIPTTYKDVVVAGVNFYANLYMNKPYDKDKVALWRSEFLDGLRQMKKDLNVNFRNTDLLLPDSASAQINPIYT